MLLKHRLPSWQNDPFGLRASRLRTRTLPHPLLRRAPDAPGRLHDAGTVTWTRLVSEKKPNRLKLWMRASVISPRPLLLFPSASNSAQWVQTRASGPPCRGKASCDLCLQSCGQARAIHPEVSAALVAGETFRFLSPQVRASVLPLGQNTESQCSAAGADLWPHRWRSGNRTSVWESTGCLIIMLIIELVSILLCKLY